MDASAGGGVTGTEGRDGTGVVEVVDEVEVDGGVVRVVDDGLDEELVLLDDVVEVELLVLVLLVVVLLVLVLDEVVRGGWVVVGAGGWVVVGAGGCVEVVTPGCGRYWTFPAGGSCLTGSSLSAPIM